ncbi:helix-turn-helix domain-containing protein [Kitasatospora sp. NPDC101801]|uniref:helix-turn-helix domain-containing protein n=1 Tax=Kitasatospora sp. NPDC101801 TaxID=3364103 RepID=UPI003810B26F
MSRSPRTPASPGSIARPSGPAAGSAPGDGGVPAAAARTAEALIVHVHTVHDRVRRIEDSTGRSLARPEDRPALGAALLRGPLPV